jgi:hypothetical protein
MLSNPHITRTQFAGIDTKTLVSYRVFDYQQVVGQFRTEAAMNFADRLAGGRSAQTAAVDPSLDCNVSRCFAL